MSAGVASAGAAAGTVPVLAGLFAAGDPLISADVGGGKVAASGIGTAASIGAGVSANRPDGNVKISAKAVPARMRSYRRPRIAPFSQNFAEP